MTRIVAFPLLALGASVVCCGVAVCVAALLLHPTVLDEALA